MNLLNQVISISPKDSPLSEEEHGMVRDIFREANIVEPERDGVLRVVNDFYYTMYIVKYEQGMMLLRLSPHKDLFRHDKTINKRGDVPVVPIFVAEGEILGKFYYSILQAPYCFSASSAKLETLDSVIDLFAGMLLVAQEQYSVEQLPTQTEAYRSIFNGYQFIQELSAQQFNRLIKRYPVITQDFLVDFSNTSWEFFNKNVLEQYPIENGGSCCFGPLRTDDIILEKASGLPHVIFYPHIMRGNPMVEAACFPHYLNLSRAKFYEAFDKKKFHKLDKLAKYAWIVDFYLTFIDECMVASIGSTFHNSNRLTNAARYQFYRGWLGTLDEFKKWLPHFDVIFLEKTLH